MNTQSGLVSNAQISEDDIQSLIAAVNEPDVTTGKLPMVPPEEIRRIDEAERRQFLGRPSNEFEKGPRIA